MVELGRMHLQRGQATSSMFSVHANYLAAHLWVYAIPYTLCNGIYECSKHRDFEFSRDVHHHMAHMGQIAQDGENDQNLS